MDFSGFTFELPKDPPPRYLPSFEAFHEEPSFGDGGVVLENVDIPANAGNILLEACKKGNWITVDACLSEFERAWTQEEGHIGVREAVNFQDPVRLIGLRFFIPLTPQRDISNF